MPLVIADLLTLCQRVDSKKRSAFREIAIRLRQISTLKEPSPPPDISSSPVVLLSIHDQTHDSENLKEIKIA
jgi:hypothetical protein